MIYSCHEKCTCNENCKAVALPYDGCMNVKMENQYISEANNSDLLRTHCYPENYCINSCVDDTYDRCIADVFYAPGGSDDAETISQSGVYLNQELLDTGHARVW